MLDTALLLSNFAAAEQSKLALEGSEAATVRGRCMPAVAISSSSSLATNGIKDTALLYKNNQKLRLAPKPLGPAGG